MKNAHWLYGGVIACLLSIVGLSALYAQVPFNGPFGPSELPYATAASPTFTGTITGAIANFSGLVTDAVGHVFSGPVAATLFGDKTAIDNNGVFGGITTTDVAPQPMTIMAQPASPIGSTNKTGGPLILTGGIETISMTAVQANCQSGDSVTVTWLDNTGTAQTKTCTRDATLNDTTHFSCSTTNDLLAQNQAACLATAAGIDACGGTACTGFTGVSGSVYVYPATGEPPATSIKLVQAGGHSTNVVTLGTVGTVVIPTQLTFGTGPWGTITAPSVGISMSPTLSDTLCIGVAGTLGDCTKRLQLNLLTVGVTSSTNSVYLSTGPRVSSGGVIGITSGVDAFNNGNDGGFSRTGAASWKFGNGTAGDATGTLTMATLSAGTSILATATTNIGWSVVAGANTACNTTCTNACVFGFDTGLGGSDLVDCADTTADRCVCAGAN